MGAAANTIIRSALQGQFDALVKQYEAAVMQKQYALGAVERVRLEGQLKTIETEMEAVEQKMNLLRFEENDPHHRHRHVQTHLPRIDFKEIKNALDKIFKKSGPEACAVILLLQKGLKFGGEQCADRIRDLLKERTGDLKHWKLEFSLRIGSRDESGVLDGLAKHLNVSSVAADLQLYSQQIVSKMCNSLQSGSIGFLDMRSWDNLQPHARVMTWFLDAFWQRTIDGLASLSAQQVGVKFVALLVADYEIPAACLPATCIGDVRKFENGKLLQFSLKKWTTQEIDDWLHQYSGLTREKIDALKTKIKYSGGVPLEVCDLLKKELAT